MITCTVFLLSINHISRSRDGRDVWGYCENMAGRWVQVFKMVICMFAITTNMKNIDKFVVDKEKIDEARKHCRLTIWKWDSQWLEMLLITKQYQTTRSKWLFPQMTFCPAKLGWKPFKSRAKLSTIFCGLGIIIHSKSEKVCWFYFSV